MRTSTRMTLAAGAAVALGAAPLGAVFEQWRWIWYAWAAIAAVVGAHLLARSLRLPAALVPVAGALGLLLYVTAVFTPGEALLSLLPTPGSLDALRRGLSEGMENVNEFAAPVPVTDGLTLLTAASLGGIAILVDLVAVTFRRPAASGLALLALYAVPTAVVLSGVPWILFAIAASGYLLLLLVEGRDRLLHWGRPVAPAGQPPAPGGREPVAPDSDAPSPLTGQRIGAAAIALAVILPLLVPGMTGNALNRLGANGSDGTGTGGGGPLNEFAALRGELRQGQPTELMRVRTDLNPPPYLRTKVLDRYTSTGFAASSNSSDDGASIDEDGPLAPPAGQVFGEQRGFKVDIDLTDAYDDDHLPIYFAPSEVTDAGSGWRWDNDKGVVVNRQRRGGFDYTVTGQEPTPSVNRLTAASPLTEDELDGFRRESQAAGVPGEVGDTVEGIVRGITGPFAQAKAINDYFTDGTNDFLYSESTIAGNSGNVLVDFLRNKQGYCEQYAAAMAVMLRLQGIPSRVVLGYLPGERQEDGSWRVTNRDAHAWVEAYFSGVGWTYFDPTPRDDRTTVAPGYAPRPSAAPTTAASGPSVSASAGPTANQLPQEDLDPGVAGGESDGQGLITPQRLLTALAVLGVILLLLVPAGVRLASRRRRLRAAAGADPGAAARAAWDEVVGSAADYGVAVPTSETPRGTARRLGRELELDTDASSGLRLVALAEERARYAARPGVDGDLPAAVRAVRRGLRGEAGRRQRLQAALLPPSTVRAARAGSASRAATASTALNRLGETVRRPVTPRRRR